MALIMATSFKGITAEYWKITRMEQDYTIPATKDEEGNVVSQNYHCKVQVALYATKAARDEGLANYLQIENFVFNTPDMTRESAYEVLHGMDRFASAIDG